MRSGANGRHDRVHHSRGVGADSSSCPFLQQALLDLARAGLETRDIGGSSMLRSPRSPPSRLRRPRPLQTASDAPPSTSSSARTSPSAPRPTACAAGARASLIVPTSAPAFRQARQSPHRLSRHGPATRPVRSGYDILHRHSRFMGSPSTPQNGIAYRHSTPASAADHPGGSAPRQRPCPGPPTRPAPPRSPTLAAPSAASRSVTSTTSTPKATEQSTPHHRRPSLVLVPVPPPCDRPHVLIARARSVAARMSAPQLCLPFPLGFQRTVTAATARPPTPRQLSTGAVP